MTKKNRKRETTCSMRIMSSVQMEPVVAAAVLDSGVIEAPHLDNESDSGALSHSGSPDRNSGVSGLSLGEESNGHPTSAEPDLPSMGGEFEADPRSPSPLFGTEMSESLKENDEMVCPYCHRVYRQPRVLHCLHSLCEDCMIALLEGHSDGVALETDGDELEHRLTPEQKPPPGVIRCPVCKQDSSIGNDARFVHSMLLDYITINLLDASAIDKVEISCESCKTKESAIARCQDCSNFLCANCVSAHQFMVCFDGHKVVKFDEIKRAQQSGDGLYVHRPIFCPEHSTEQLRYFCTTCRIPVCNECAVTNHKPPEHGTQKVDAGSDEKIRQHLETIINTGNETVNLCQTTACNIESRASDLKNSVEASRESIDQAFDLFKEALETRRLDLHNELESLHGQHEQHLLNASHNFQRTSQKIADACRFTERLLKYGNSMELLVSEKAVSQQFNQLQHSVPKGDVPVRVNFESSKQEFDAALKNCCGRFNSDLFGPSGSLTQFEQLARYIASSPQPPNAWQSPPHFNRSLEPHRPDSVLDPTGRPRDVICGSTGGRGVGPSPQISEQLNRNIQNRVTSAADWSLFHQDQNTVNSTGTGGFARSYHQAPIPFPAQSGSSQRFQQPVQNSQLQSGGNLERTDLRGLGLPPSIANNLYNLGLARLGEAAETNAPASLPLDGLGTNSAVYNSFTSFQRPPDFPTPSSENTSPSPYQHSAAPTPMPAQFNTIVPSSLPTSVGNNYGTTSGRSSATPCDSYPGVSGFGGLINESYSQFGVPASSHSLVPVSGPSRGITPPQYEYGDLPNAFASVQLACGAQAPQGIGGVTNPPVRTTKMPPMQIKSKFGSLGPANGQFNSPHGFCLGFEEEIVVADTNNHRIEIFHKDGTFKNQFGVPGKEEGQLWYPRKVAVSRVRDFRYIVCDRGNERSRMQIFSRNGAFIKKIAIRYIDIVAGLCVDSEGHVVAVDSVSPTVFRIDESGELLKWFDCSDYMKEPSDIAVSGREYFICDFKGHNVCVFSDEGHFLRRIGTEKITSFPNGIDISDAGDVLIGDSHGNKFHVSIFKKNGEFETEFDCPFVKVSRCCGLRISSEGDIITLAKNNHHVLVLHQLYLQ